MATREAKRFVKQYPFLHYASSTGLCEKAPVNFIGALLIGKHMGTILKMADKYGVELAPRLSKPFTIEEIPLEVGGTVFSAFPTLFKLGCGKPAGVVIEGVHAGMLGLRKGPNLEGKRYWNDTAMAGLSTAISPYVTILRDDETEEDLCIPPHGGFRMAYWKFMGNTFEPLRVSKRSIAHAFCDLMEENGLKRPTLNTVIYDKVF